VTLTLVSRGADLSEDSREIIKALVHGAYRGRTRLGTRITEDAGVSLRCMSPLLAPLYQLLQRSKSAAFWGRADAMAT